MGAKLRIDVCLVSTNDISREGMTLILEKDGFNVVNSWESVDEIEPVKSSADFITILDCGPLASQLDAVERARNSLPSSRLVVVSEQFDLKTVIDCFSAGVQGYIIKSGRSTRMLAALRLVALVDRTTGHTSSPRPSPFPRGSWRPWSPASCAWWFQGPPAPVSQPPVR